MFLSVPVLVVASPESPSGSFVVLVVSVQLLLFKLGTCFLPDVQGVIRESVLGSGVSADSISNLSLCRSMLE